MSRATRKLTRIAAAIRAITPSTSRHIDVFSAEIDHLYWQFLPTSTGQGLMIALDGDHVRCALVAFDGSGGIPVPIEPRDKSEHAIAVAAVTSAIAVLELLATRAEGSPLAPMIGVTQATLHHDLARL